MKIKLLLVMLFFLFITGCSHHYVTWDAEKVVFLINKGDKIIRTDIEPNEIEAGFDGEFISENEIMRLRKIEEDYYMEIKY